MITVRIDLADGIRKKLCGNTLFFEHLRESLFLERPGIQNLVATACVETQRNQNIGFLQCKKFEDGIGAGSGDNDIGSGEEIRQFLGDEFILSVSFTILKAFIEIAFTTEVDDSEIFQ